MAKCRGHFPRVENCSTGCNFPSSASIPKRVMVSKPQFETYRNCPLRMHGDFGGVVLTLEVRRQRGNHLYLMHRSVVESEDRDRGIQFIQDVDCFAVRQERRVARPRTLRDTCEGLSGGKNPRQGRIESIDKHLIESEIHGDHETIVGRDVDVMRVRFILPFVVRVRTGRRKSLVRIKCHRVAQSTVGINSQCGETSASIVGDERSSAGMIDGK